MHKFFAYLRSINPVWLLTWLTIYVLFLVLDLIWTGAAVVTAVKYLGIVLCVVYAFLKWPKDHLLHVALMFTLAADTILVFNHTSPVGVFIFCLAQFFHLARLSQMHFSLRAFVVYVIIVMLLSAFGATQHLELIYPLAATYLVTLIFNVMLAFQWYKKSRSTPSMCACYGFILFLCCDINVGISYFSSIGSLPIWMLGPANYFAWAFYYPAQVLISNSSKKIQKSFKKTKNYDIIDTYGR